MASIHPTKEKRPSNTTKELAQILSYYRKLISPPLDTQIILTKHTTNFIILHTTIKLAELLSLYLTLLFLTHNIFIKILIAAISL